ncbi:major prion protein-like [Eleutherodactylus coqui]|uniref:major prion protein-like n=1 Tax=Eleutherodactylus coqui TaxID=57060 RepID=UPI003463390E
MTKIFWIQVALIFLFLVSMVASMRGGEKSSKGGGRDSGSSQSPSHGGNNEPNQNLDHTGNTESKQNPGHRGNTGSKWNLSHTGNTGGHLNPSHTGNTGGYLNPSDTGNSGGNWNLQEPPNPRNNWNPQKPANPGSYWNPGGSLKKKQSKPPKSKTNMKYVSGAAVAGGVVGFMLGNAVSNMRYRFDNDMDSRYYNSYQSQMPNRVYRPMYQDNSYMTENRFVTDCYNVSMNEYVIKPNEGKNDSDIDQTEVRVKSTVIRQLCVSEYKRGSIHPIISGINLLFSPSLSLFITLFVYFVGE